MFYTAVAFVHAALTDLKALAKSSPAASTPSHPAETPAAADGEAALAEGTSSISTTTSTSAAAAAVRETLLVHHPLCELHSIPGEDSAFFAPRTSSVYTFGVVYATITGPA